MDLEEDWGSVPNSMHDVDPGRRCGRYPDKEVRAMWPWTRASHDTELLSFSPTGMHMDMHMH